ncbi:alcohol dehydrogenase-like protein [Lipomyces japonicus]|uniref:alcohol dehydrogenase-like protein n=1 Tax=Lipomyces japonicus TaxID=56871 RepID=UPI0034CE4F72
MTVSEIPETQLAQVLRSFNSPYKLETVPVDLKLHPHDLLIKVGAAGYCHTDAVYSSGAMKQVLPIINSHEFVGTIVARGEKAANVRHLQVGSRVGVPGRIFRPCGTCSECANNEEDEPGYSVYCPFGGSLGLSTNGGFQEYALADSRQVVPLPDELSDVEAAPLMCAGLTIYSAIKKIGLRVGQSLAIVGCGGGLGHLGLQYATKLGLEVIGIDIHDAAIELSKSLYTGAQIFDARTHTPQAVLDIVYGPVAKAKISPERGVDAVIILPEVQEAFEYGISLLHDHATLCLVSFPKDGFHLDARSVVYRDLKVIGSLIGTTRTAKEMVQFSVDNYVRAKVETFALKDLNILVEEYHSGRAGKFVIDFSL